MITLQIKNKEVDIKLDYTSTIGGKPEIKIFGTGDLSHHLVEGIFDIVDRLARMENVAHQASDWKEK